jgi:hypothetical protein
MGFQRSGFQSPGFQMTRRVLSAVYLYFRRRLRR